MMKFGEVRMVGPGANGNLGEARIIGCGLIVEQRSRVADRERLGRF